MLNRCQVLGSISVTCCLLALLLGCGDVPTGPAEPRHLTISDVETYPGGIVTVTLSMDFPEEIGQFWLAVAHDATLKFLGAESAGGLDAWEYFTYRKSNGDSCGGGCPLGIVRLIGLANTPDGVEPDESVYSPTGEIIELAFRAPEELEFVDHCFPIRWVWNFCEDNSLTHRDGTQLFICENTDVLPDSGCFDDLRAEKHPEPMVTFGDGQVCIIPFPDDRGGIDGCTPPIDCDSS